jgi:hypothetical protein
VNLTKIKVVTHGTDEDPTDAVAIGESGDIVFLIVFSML